MKGEPTHLRGWAGGVKEGKVDVLPPSSYWKVAAWEPENKKEGGWHIK